METNRTFMWFIGEVTPGSPFECASLIVDFFTRVIHHLVMAAAIFVHGALNFFPGLASPFLDAANQFILLSLDELQLVIRKLRKPLFQLALGNVPISFGSEQTHKILRSIVLLPPFDDTQRHETRLQLVCRSIVAPIVSANPSI